MPVLTVIVEQCLAPVPGGTGRYARQITRALAATSPDGWRVRSVSAWHRDVSPAVIDGVDGPHRLPVGGRVLSRAWQAGLPPFVRGDTVHAVTPLAPRRRGRPQVVTVHDTVPWTHPGTLTPRGVAWHREMIGRAARDADALVVPTHTVARELAELFPAAADKIVAIGHGVTALPAADEPDRVALALGLPERFVLSVATLEPRKGLDVLMSAMAVPGGDLRQIPLVVVGQPGWGGIDLAAAAASAGLPAGRVRPLGRISDAELGVVYGRAAVLAVPSRAEGFGLPLLEGFAAGVPVVCSDAPALVEVAGGAALVVPVGDAQALAAVMASVLGDRDLAAGLVRRGHARAADFTWERAAGELWTVHQRVAVG